MTKIKIMMVCGTRPEIIKMAPVYYALNASDYFVPILIHTGQHTDLAMPLYRAFGMLPTRILVMNRSQGTLAQLTGNLLDGLSQMLDEFHPSALLVHGDTASAMAAALAGFYAQMPVGHVEAGLRTYDKYSPFPEEMNRSVIGRLADWHYAPTPAARQALLGEGISDSHIVMTGNTGIDAALQIMGSLADAESPPRIVVDYGIHQRIVGRRLLLVTAHRRENWGDGLLQIARAVDQLLSRYDDFLVIWPLHANPAVSQSIRHALDHRCKHDSKLLLCPPLDYPALIWLQHHAWLVMTDSGGIQEESVALGTPVLILRDTTERPELISVGGGLLVGANYERICETVDRLNDNPDIWSSMKNIRNPFGDGLAAERIVSHLKTVL
ncbi:non-hydrolyzing UDP-N-acetylglucosamine 2-epimerase [Salmonella enterica]|nr:UDP-N-acetylglucosamine 2-epimerase (non-hydrolyzing) [Salmonella enterica]EDR1539084.1 UDP-N-acetylglucosamine 2-epimerase (non-hydrolyzing) [Salmonella enterica subsp. enterica serovar Javiana]EGO3302073.1 UDP-N-acetylglucosamine 2-epimerase (non-hydrolyzing) [Salmonella enterica]EHC5972838.1 UDP-N-acetylglucosamine 2-epimerase (non-hydrolyzing) [Salmonella enterica]EIU9581238.1 UDP-N-acetylglucosamine 2-epimerase (non-hydrolyzing) [Salmonella enterica]